ncbi:hypothetical protein C0Z18_20610 [Trinickia dabaoshanensis]|uniref:Metallo-beta-lactamase domain-containing protein n=1 Tax=Trinickia dabaoshanensis TaxID=564714 RepID=A0A2N7VK49_9BURK|nr:MBL fold metallo-hydrolase [Trinickia dabaoshanensis]PMS17487.1 hypothetical protein C0Z18_20610 [Trinickia dabaoshanensis]
MDKVKVQSLAVGHGECTLIEFSTELHPPFRILIDAGARYPNKLDELILKPHKIDLLVLTHVDDDHLGGMEEVVEKFEIGAYWGPCLAAFKRYEWLFEARVAKGIARAGDLEAKLREKQVSIINPVENFSLRDATGKLFIEVLSPPGRVIRELLTAPRFEDVRHLFETSPMPLQYLLLPEVEGGNDGEIVPAALSHTLASGYVAVDEATRLPPIVPLTPQATQKIKNEFVKATGVAPEFFGNSVLNDTSLVVRITANLDGRHYRRILLAGDLENWTYLAGKYPNGLHCDVVKAPHHGGRLYFERDIACNEVSAWLKARHFIVSANGRHKLPRTVFRDAVRQTGASLFCPNVRTKEIVRQAPSTTAGATHDSCFALHDCNKDAQNDITLEMTAECEQASPPPCVQGFSGTSSAPIVVLTQRIVEPDEIINRYTTGELVKTEKWIVSKLREWHRCRMRRHPATGWQRASTNEFGLDELVSEAQGEDMFQFSENPIPAIRYAAGNGNIWLSADFGYRTPHEDVRVYLWPKENDLKPIYSWAAKHIAYIFPFKQDTWSVSSVREALRQIDSSMVEAKIEYQFGMPVKVIEQVIWPAIASRLLAGGWHLTAFRRARYGASGELVLATLTPTRYAPDYAPFSEPDVLDKMLSGELMDNPYRFGPTEIFDNNMRDVVFGRINKKGLWLNCGSLDGWQNEITVGEALTRNHTPELL